MFSIIVAKNDSGQRIDKFLFKVMPDIPKSLLYRSLRQKNIKLNGKKADISALITEGDKIDAYITDEFFKKPESINKTPAFLKSGKNLDIVYEDDNIILINKPAGLICHSDKNEFNDTLIDRIKRYLYENGKYNPFAEQSFSPALANRIDRNTCGIVIAAKNAEALRILNKKIKSREILKYYLCLVTGKMPRSHDTIKGNIIKDEKNNIVKIVEKGTEGSSEIITEYSVLENFEKYSLLEIKLITGKTHQIRAHLASIGHPILGDPKYNKIKSGKTKSFPFQALCSYRLLFNFSSDAGILSYLDKMEFKIQNIWFLL